MKIKLIFKLSYFQLSHVRLSQFTLFKLSSSRRPAPVQGGSRWYVYNTAPFSVSHRFPFPSVSRPVPFHTISVSFRFAGSRVGSFPFHSVSHAAVSLVFRFIPFRGMACHRFSVSFRFVLCRVPTVPFRPVSYFPCHTVSFRLGYSSDIYIYI